MSKTITNNLMSIFAAIGLISLFKGLVTIQEDFAFILSAYTDITRTVWNFLFGWLEELFNFKAPIYIKDYMVIGFIVFGAAIRSLTVNKASKTDISVITLIIVVILLSPIFLFLSLLWPVIVIQFLFALSVLLLLQHKSIFHRFNVINKWQIAAWVTDKDNPEHFKENKRFAIQTLKQLPLFMSFIYWTLALLLINYGLFLYEKI